MIFHCHILHRTVEISYPCFLLVKNYFDIICIIRIIFTYFQYSVYCIKKKKIEMFNGDIMVLSTILVLMI